MNKSLFFGGGVGEGGNRSKTSTGKRTTNLSRMEAGLGLSGERHEVSSHCFRAPCKLLSPGTRQGGKLHNPLNLSE